MISKGSSDIANPRLGSNGAVSRGAIKRLLKVGLIIILGTSGLGAAVIFIMSLRQIELSGKVVSSNTNLPVSDALVYVESGCPWEEAGMNESVRTDEHGRFTFKARCDVIVRVWKSGFSMTDVALGQASMLVGKENIIKIREITAKNPVSENTDRSGFAIGDGFSFSLGKIVNADSAQADIKLSRGANGKDVFIEALGEGGLYFQRYSQGVDFYNTPEAPLAGYSKRMRITPEPPIGLYYVRTRDGEHFAKIRLSQGLRQTPTGWDHSVYWLHWVYQPDGSRYLEIAVGKEYLFPFEKFGLKRDSLK
jgi:hypothetical protein